MLTHRLDHAFCSLHQIWCTVRIIQRCVLAVLPKVRKHPSCHQPNELPSRYDSLFDHSGGSEKDMLAVLEIFDGYKATCEIVYQKLPIPYELFAYNGGRYLDEETRKIWFPEDPEEGDIQCEYDDSRLPLGTRL